MDAALMLENGAYCQVSARALKAYREADHRAPSHADLVYPSDADALAETLQGYIARAPDMDGARPATSALAGIVCPHIDYERGAETYAQLWKRCAPYLEDVQLAVIFGTDHSVCPWTLTPTRQDYSTPLGILPTDRDTVDGLAEAPGGAKAFEEELHHVNEHSIELALVWFHHAIGGRRCAVVPVLCGSFHSFLEEGADPSESETIAAAVSYLRGVISGRRTVVIAAADLAHVGPAFGDTAPIDIAGRTELAAQDAESISAIFDGDAEALFSISRLESDARRLCGLPPIYMALRLLGRTEGESLGYAQCPADANGGSLVSIVGALLYEAP